MPPCISLRQMYAASGGTGISASRFGAWLLATEYTGRSEGLATSERQKPVSLRNNTTFLVLDGKPDYD
jgi:hypothetical protein